MRPDSYHTRSPDSMDFYAEENAHVNINKFEISEKTLSILAIVLAVFAAAVASFFYTRAVEAERETRMLEYYVMELDGKLMKQGVITPDESWSAHKSKQEK